MKLLLVFTALAVLVGCKGKSRVVDGPSPCQHPIFSIPENHLDDYCLDD